MEPLTNAQVELRAVQQAMVHLYNAGQIDSYFDHLDEHVIYNVPEESLPLVGKRAVCEWYTRFLAQYERVHWDGDPYPIVAGGTGILSGAFTFTIKPIGRDEVTLTGQHTVIFSRMNGAWKKVGEHANLDPAT